MERADKRVAECHERGGGKVEKIVALKWCILVQT